MERSRSIVSWLLLAAMLCVDFVASLWIFEIRFRSPSTTVFVGLAFGQINMLCAWAAISRHGIGYRWLAPFAAAGVAGVLMGLAENNFRIEEPLIATFIGLGWAQVALTLPALWVVRPRMVSAGPNRSDQPRWQFGVRHLLGLMTCLAALLTVLRRSKALSDHAVDVSIFVICNTLLSVAIVAAIYKLKVHGILRLAACLAVAIAIAIPCEWFRIGLGGEIDTFSLNLIQAIILWSWLEALRPTPGDITTDDAGA